MRRLAVLAQIEAEDARERLHTDVVARPVPLRAGLAVSGDRRVDDPWVALLDGIVVDAEPLHDTGTERLDHDIGSLGEGEEGLAPLRRLQIDDDALLPAMGVAEPDALAAGAVAQMTGRLALPRRLDLDHLRAVVGHHHREMRTGQEHREIDDANAFELHFRSPPQREAPRSPTGLAPLLRALRRCRRRARRLRWNPAAHRRDGSGSRPASGQNGADARR